jgi:hypothetical protein
LVDGSVGYWLQPNAIVGGQVQYEKTEIDTMPDQDTLSFGVFGKVVHPLGEGRSLNGEAHLSLVSVDDGTSKDDNFDLGIAVDFYFTPQYSVGALVDFSVGDAKSAEGTTLGIRGTAWLMPQLSVNVGYSTFMAENDTFGSDKDTFSVFFTARF